MQKKSEEMQPFPSPRGMGRHTPSENLFSSRPLFAQNVTKRFFKNFERMGTLEPEVAYAEVFNGRSSSQIIMTSNLLVKSVIKIKTALLTSK